MLAYEEPDEGPSEEQSARDAATAGAAAATGGVRHRDGSSPAGDLRLRVLHQEPAPSRVRQSAQGAPNLRQGGGRQRARRVRGSGPSPGGGGEGGSRPPGAPRPRPRARPPASGSP